MPSKLKTITIKFSPVKITFAKWYEWYGDRYRSKFDAMEVWNQMTADKERCTIQTQVCNKCDGDDYLQQLYFGDRTVSAEAVIANHRRQNGSAAHPEKNSIS
jgi:hypothetical protein